MSTWSEGADDDGEVDPDLGERPPPRLPREHHGTRRLVGVTAFVLVALALAALAQVASEPRVSLPPGRQTGTSAGPSPRASAGTPVPTRSSAAELTAAADALLAARAQAVVDDDLASWRSGEIPGAVTPHFTRLAALPIASWRYTVESVSEPVEDAGGLAVTARLAYRFQGEADSTVITESLILRRVSGALLVASERTADRRAQPWDLGDITVARGKRSLVIGIDTTEPRCRAGCGWRTRSSPTSRAPGGASGLAGVVVVVPRSSQQLARALARTADSLGGDRGGDHHGRDGSARRGRGGAGVAQHTRHVPAVRPGAGHRARATR